MAEFAVVTDFSALPAHLRGGVVAIGNFDGVHRGHQAVLRSALDEARANGMPALVLTFEPHPRTVFRPDIVLPRITPWPLKARLLRLLGFDAVIRQDFDRGFAAKSAEAFVGDVLVDGFDVVHAVTGFDFHFGQGRQGDPAFLVDAGLRHGFAVTQVEVFTDEGCEPVSSSRIRSMLGEGGISAANGLLGYRYTVEGEVVRGRQLGRTLGYPTANMALPGDAVLRHGVYAVRFRRAGGDLFDGVASFGKRPTVDEDGAPLLETFLFDFDGDLYGEICDVSFFGFLRGEEKFDGLEPLMARMRQDEAEARALLAGVQPLSTLDRSVTFPEAIGFRCSWVTVGDKDSIGVYFNCDRLGRAAYKHNASTASQEMNFMMFRTPAALALPFFLATAGVACAQDGGGWFSGDWSLTLGASGYLAPSYEGADGFEFMASPIISFGRQGTIEKFSSRNDNISIGFIDTGSFRAGPTGKLIFERDGGDDDDLEGLDPVRFGGEIGAFAEFYPTDWARIRAEVRQGIRSHDGIVADINVDAFYNATPVVRVSGGPRLSLASAGYFESYYGVDADESAESGLSQYDPGGGVKSVGVGGAIDWKTTDRFTTSLFGEYARLVGPAADSSLVEERGSENQFTVGVSASYRFDFTIP